MLRISMPNSSLARSCSGVAGWTARTAIAAVRSATSVRRVVALPCAAPLTAASVRSFACSPFIPPRSSSFSSSAAAAAGGLDVPGALEKLGSAFANARMDIEDALESVGSTYYPADIALAQTSTQDVLDAYSALQRALLDAQPSRAHEAQKIRESWSLRLEQLKAELDAAVAAGGADH